MSIRKGKKILAQSRKHDDEEKGQPLQANGISNMETRMQLDGKSGPTREADLDVILKEQQEFRRDSSQQQNGIVKNLRKNGRINVAETRIQSAEDVLSELVKLHVQTEAKQTDSEGHSHRDNVRIHGVKEGAEEIMTRLLLSWRI